MCIIVVKPRESPLPPKETLKICFENNPDGAGYMYSDGNKVHIIKGFFEFEALWKSIQSVKDVELCIHFRWATHGEVARGNCHPFPLTKCAHEMKNTRAHCTMGIAHNGIIRGLVDSKTLSDTMIFIKQLDTTKKITSQLSVEVGNKFCVITHSRTLLIGDFIYDNDTGCYFSNDGYKEMSPIVYYKNSDVDTLYRECYSCTRSSCVGCSTYEEVEYDYGVDHKDIEFFESEDILADGKWFNDY